MTTTPDWAGVLARANRGPGVQLAAKVPAACQTCGGSQILGGPNGYYADKGKPCRDCPTIADLLHWGYNVATWTQPIRPPFTSVRDIPSPAQAERDLLAALRTTSQETP